MAQHSRAVHGAQLKVYINNRVFGIVTGMNFQSSTGRKAIYGIDHGDPIELAEGAASVTGTMEVLRVKNDGGIEGYGIVAQHHKLRLEKYITICVVDRSTDTVIFQTDRALVKGQNWSVNSRGIMTGNFTFECIGFVTGF